MTRLHSWISLRPLYQAYKASPLEKASSPHLWFCLRTTTLCALGFLSFSTCTCLTSSFDQWYFMEDFQSDPFFLVTTLFPFGSSDTTATIASVVHLLEIYQSYTIKNFRQFPSFKFFVTSLVLPHWTFNPTELLSTDSICIRVLAARFLFRCSRYWLSLLLVLLVTPASHSVSGCSPYIMFLYSAEFKSTSYVNIMLT